MNSPHQREQLPDLLSDALDTTERARVESHLAQCAQCARELRALERMQQSLATLPVAASPESVRRGVRAALRENKSQVWTLPAFLAARKRTSVANQESTARARAAKPLQRIGAPKALPFALPARQLAWGGAVAIGAIGVMLLARPSLQNDSPTLSAPVGEAELASRAASDQNSASANDSFAGNVGSATSGATANSAKGGAKNSAATNSVTGAADDSATTHSPTVPTTSEKPQTKPDASSAPKFAPGSASPMPESNAQLPPLPPPPPRARMTPPENFAPAPRNNEPSLDFLPAPPPRNPRPQAPAAIAPESKSKARPPVKSAPPVQSVPAAPPEIQSPPAKATRPALPAADAESRADASNQNDFAPAPMNEAPQDNSSNRERVGRRSNSDANAPASSAPPSVTNRALEAPLSAQKSAANPSPEWTGGDVVATLSRGTAKNQPPVLTLGVAKAIGNARLILRLPSGETQVWRGSMNAVPLEIKLPNLPDNLRSGQRIRARLEQTDGAGNPKGSINLSLTWP